MTLKYKNDTKSYSRKTPNEFNLLIYVLQNNKKAKHFCDKIEKQKTLKTTIYGRDETKFWLNIQHCTTE